MTLNGPLRATVILAALVAAVPACAEPVASRTAALQAACFAPEALGALNGEEQIVRGEHHFDRPAVAGALAPFTPVAPPLRGAIRRVELPPGQKVIALTFDLCEQRGEIAGYEGRIIDYLRAEGVRATLFTGGKWMWSHQARTEQLMTDPLFELANHSTFHRNLRLLDSRAVRDEIEGPQHIYEHVRTRLGRTQCAAKGPGDLEDVPPRLTLFRFPFGACTRESLDAVNDAGLLAIQWDVSTGDPDPHQSAQAIAHAMVHEVKPGSIIIGHSNGRGWHTAEALRIAVPKLKAMGYRFVTVTELLAMGKPVVVPECYDRKPGDTNRYDHLLGAHAIPGAAHASSPGAAPAAGGWLPSAGGSTPPQVKSKMHGPLGVGGDTKPAAVAPAVSHPLAIP